MPTVPLEGESLYRALQQHLDRMPVPFPATESGVELRILRRIYAQDEARLALCLSTIPEGAGAIRRRLRPVVDRQTLIERLDGMAERGLLQRVRAGRRVLYGKTVFVVGFYEAQVNRLTPDLQRDVEQYADEAFGRALHGRRTPQMRTVPVNGVIPNERAVGRYDDIRAIVRAADGPFAVMPCICQQGKDLLGQPCRQTDHREHCLTLGAAARHMVARGDARYLTREETLEFLDRADRDGLVVEPQNIQDPMFICTCCGCCCGVLTTAKKMPRPADFFATNYVAEVAADDCTSCGMCETRCQMDAVSMDDGPARVDAGRCIGCALCVTTCPTGAMRLLEKPGAAPPPKDVSRLYGRMFAERFGAGGLVATVAKRLVGMKS